MNIDFTLDQFQIHPAVFFRKYHDFIVVYQTENQMVYTFNESAGDVLECFVELSTFEDLLHTIIQKYDISGIDEIRQDMESFVEELCAKGILKKKYRQNDEFRNLEKEVVSKLSVGKQLYMATIELTYKCNERCRHCYVVDEFKNEMSFEEIKTLLDDLAEMNTFNIVFTGGEVFVRKDAFEILEYAYSKHFVIDIFTNGNLIDGNDYIRLKNIWPRCVHFSLYSHIPQKHDAITRVQGSFEKTIKSIKSCAGIGIPVNIKTPVFSETKEDIKGVVDLANEIGCTVELGWTITPKKNGNLSPLKMRVSKGEEEERVIQTINELVSAANEPDECIRQVEKLCGAGDNSLSINPYGEVYPCNLLQLCIGDIREESIKNIWDSSERLKKWREINKRACREGCGECAYADSCHFCPGEAMIRTGNPLSRYEEACEATEYALKYKRKGGGGNG